MKLVSLGHDAYFEKQDCFMGLKKNPPIYQIFK